MCVCVCVCVRKTQKVLGVETSNFDTLFNITQEWHRFFFGEEKLTITPANRLFCVYLEKTVLPYYVFPLSKFCDVKYYDVMYGHVYLMRCNNYTVHMVYKSYKNIGLFHFSQETLGGVAGIFSMRASDRGLSSVILLSHYNVTWHNEFITL